LAISVSVDTMTRLPISTGCPLEGGLHHELAHAGDGEDGFDDDAAADKARHREPEDRHDRQQRVAKGVLADDHALLGEALTKAEVAGSKPAPPTTPF
jgi:hypothetical protein